MDQYTAFCLKCKEKRDFTGKVDIAKNGTRIAKGHCPTCGTGMARILPKLKS